MHSNAVFNPKSYTQLPRLKRSEILPAERRLNAFFRWSWVVFVLAIGAMVALNTGLLGIPKEGPSYDMAVMLISTSLPVAVCFGLVLQILSLPAEIASKKLAENRFTQSLHSLSITQLDTILAQPRLSPEIAGLVKDEILRRIRT